MPASIHRACDGHVGTQTNLFAIGGGEKAGLVLDAQVMAESFFSGNLSFRPQSPVIVLCN
ncbi:hypothetical protein ACCD00_10115 [Pseudomonas sp. Pseusp3]|uniref:hypothetical protein n=1 Tax=Pseudomonas sp. Pseusp3 TaxID=3243029 RepID=UPI0039AF9436